MHFGILKMTERAPRLLISPLAPNWGRPLQCGLEICTSHLGFSLGKNGLMTLRERTEPSEMLITKVEPETYSMKRHTNVQRCRFPRQKGQRPDGKPLFVYSNTLIERKCQLGRLNDSQCLTAARIGR